LYEFAPATRAAAGQSLDLQSAAAQWHPTKAQKEAAWEKAERIPFEPEGYGLDCMEGVIQRKKYGLLGDGGWDIDHSRPKSRGGTDHPNNLHPLQSDTNRYEKGAQLATRDRHADPIGSSGGGERGGAAAAH